MKKVILFVAVGAVIALVIASCNTNSSAVKAVSYQDTAGLAQFQAWKAMKEQMLFEQSMTVADPAPVQKTRTVYVKPKTERVVMNSSSTHEAKVEEKKKKGWSKAAKYAVIGGGSGAVLGAVINKKDRVKGGAVGAVVLGGLGYVIGRGEDRKDGRIK
ncbi:MAG TPA: hypothetical protein VF476_15140 [Chitinophagaceae bacterium]